MSQERSSPLLHLGHPDSHVPKFEAPQVASKVVSHRRIFLLAGIATALAFAGAWFHHVGEHAATPAPGTLWMLPFVLLLVAIATMPFIARHFWEQHYHHVAVALAAIIAVYYVLVLPASPVPGALKGHFFAIHAGGLWPRGSPIIFRLFF